ncbi:MAG: PIN domain-containing protein [Novosphingobium sp.]
MPHAIDTNIAVYAFGQGDKVIRALDVLEGATISVQVLNEFANVALRKLAYTTAKLDERIDVIRWLVDAIEPIDETTHDLARDITARYKLSFYDSLIIAAALLADCETLYSEDMQHGLIIEGRLTIRNPFV